MIEKSLPASLPRAIILTARPIEYCTVRSFLVDIEEEKHSRGTIYESGIFIFEDQRWNVIILETMAGGINAALEAQQALDRYNPDCIFFVGVAGGLKDVKIGDLVIATKVYGYESGKADIDFLTRPEVGNAPYALLHRARIEAVKNDWQQLLGESVPEVTPHVHLGPIAAGEKVVTSTSSHTSKLLGINYGDALAVEMESHGFLRAIHVSQHTNALIIRGISDLLDGKKHSDLSGFQEIAARHACAFAFWQLIKFAEDRFPVANKAVMHPLAIEELEGNIPYPYSEIAQSVQSESSISHQQDTYQEYTNRGASALKRGIEALKFCNYVSAMRHLVEASHLLVKEHFPEELAQVYYLQALTHLSGYKPSDLPPATYQKVERCINSAIHLHETYSYVYTLALFKHDFARKANDHSMREVQELRQQANRLPRSLKDEENLHLLSSCQPRLMNIAQM